MRFLLLPLLLALPAPGTAAGAGQAPAAEAGPAPAYPRVSLSPEYAVVPGWPQRPAEAAPAAVPAIAIDERQQVWVYTRTNPVVQIYREDGRFLRGWREEDPRTIPHGIKFDAEGHVWLVDVGLHVARKFDREGRLLLTLGTLGEAGEDERHFRKPTDIAFTSNGDIFVADGYGNARVVRFDRHGRHLGAWGGLGMQPGQFSLVHAIAADSRDRLYVADRNNVRVQVFNSEGRLLDTWSNILVPWGFHITAQDEIWVCGSSPMTWRLGHPKYPGAPLGCPPKDQLFMKFNTAGRLLEHWTLPKGEDGAEKPGDVNWIHAIAVNGRGDLYVGDIIGKRVQKFQRR